MKVFSLLPSTPEEKFEFEDIKRQIQLMNPSAGSSAAHSLALARFQQKQRERQSIANAPVPKSPSKAKVFLAGAALGAVVSSLLRK